jgi:hypothetical protein
MDEISFALDEEKTVIPLLLEPCRVPFRLRRVQYVDFQSNYEEGLQRLFTALATEHQLEPIARATAMGAADQTVTNPPVSRLAQEEKEKVDHERIQREIAEAAQKEQERLDTEKAEAAQKAEQERVEPENADAKQAEQKRINRETLSTPRTSAEKSRRPQTVQWLIGAACVGSLFAVIWRTIPTFLSHPPVPTQMAEVSKGDQAPAASVSDTQPKLIDRGPQPTPLLTVTLPNTLQAQVPITKLSSSSSIGTTGNQNYQINVNYPSTGKLVSLISSGQRITFRAQISPGFKIVRVNAAFRPEDVWTASCRNNPNANNSTILSDVAVSGSISETGQTSEIIVTDQGSASCSGVANLLVSINYIASTPN